MTTCRSAKALSSSCASSPAAPSRKATQVLVSAAINCSRPDHNHRSAFSSARAREKRTFPRSCRRRAYVSDAATSCSPSRTVSVIPAPLARCAFSSSSSGTSTVILRAVCIPHFTILNTSIEYGLQRCHLKLSNLNLYPPTLAVVAAPSFALFCKGWDSLASTNKTALILGAAKNLSSSFARQSPVATRHSPLPLLSCLTHHGQERRHGNSRN